MLSSNEKVTSKNALFFKETLSSCAMQIHQLRAGSSISLVSSLSANLEESVKAVAKLESHIHEIERGQVAQFNLLDSNHRPQTERAVDCTTTRRY